MSQTEETVAVGEPAPQVAHVPAWRPLAIRLFRALWIASLFSNIGSWMHEVGAAWLMTTLQPRPFMVGLVPAAANLAVFLLALPAGALADVMDRRRMLILTQVYLVTCTAALALNTFAGFTGPWLLLAFTFMLAMGNAMTWPAWQAIIPELVPKQQISAALTLGGISFNLSRIVGPALGGLIVAKAGPAAVFAANSVSYLGVVLVFVVWRREPVERSLPEPMVQAMRAGIRYLRYSPPHRVVLARTATVILGGSALWALLPLFARQVLKLGPTGYGALMGWLGVGAVAGALSLPWIRNRVSSNRIITVGSIGIGSHLILQSIVRDPVAVKLSMLFGGFCWPTVMLSLNIGVLHQSPEWVRSRMAAIYLLVFTGVTAIGSSMWGSIAEHTGMPAAMAAAGVLLIVTAPLVALMSFPREGESDLTPSNHWAAHEEEDVLEHDDGPVLVTINYRIRSASRVEFRRAMQQVRLVRLRNGAFRWNLLESADEDGHFSEMFLVHSWAEHLRQHERLTIAEKHIEENAARFHTGPEPPAVQHLVRRTTH